MILKSINDTTDAMLEYYKKLVELEGAVTAFNHDLVVAKLNDIQVLRIRQVNIQNRLTQVFIKETDLEWTKENFANYCETLPVLKSAFNNLKDYTNECKKLSQEVLNCNNEAMKVAVKFLGNGHPKKVLIEKKGIWGKKAKR